jgi:excisionase family DNA binding protein
VLSVRQVATRLGISASLVYALCSAGLIRHTRHGRPGKRGCIRIEDAALEEYRAACKGEGQRAAAPLVLKHVTVS